MTRDEVFAQAREALRAGHLEQAEKLCGDVLTETPADATALHMLGLLAHRRGDLPAARALIGRALETQPDFPHAHRDLGIVQQKLGQPAEAAASYRRALALKGDLVMARVNLAGLLQRQGDAVAAIRLLRAGLKASADRFELHNNLGLALLAAGRPGAAVTALRKAVELAPRLAAIHLNLARALAGTDLVEEAVERYRRALEIAPENAEALAGLALAEQGRGNLIEASALAERAVALAPGVPIAQRALALCRRTEGRLAEAARAARAALALEPQAAEAYLDLAGILDESGHRADAVPLYDALLLRHPGNAEALARRARCLLGLGRFRQAWKGLGDAGWLSPPRSREDADAPQRWDGTPFPSRSLRLTCDPGLGDSIQLIRYAPVAAARGGRVHLACPTPLRRLFSGVPGIELGEAPADVEAALSDLPRLFATELDSIPAGIPYLHADERIVRLWANRLAPLPRPRIGLCWRGSPGAGDEKRFIPLSLLVEAFDGIEASLVSLQRDAARKQIAAAPRVFDPKADPAYGAAAFEDFADTAGILANLELVVSVDTANAHLAGALGRPVYLLLPFAADWRWLEGRDDSPWYPTLTLLRQREAGAWEEVVGRLNAMLKRWRGSFRA